MKKIEEIPQSAWPEYLQRRIQGFIDMNLRGWLPTTDLDYFATLEYEGTRYGAVFTGLSDWTRDEHPGGPYLLFILGCDDADIIMRFDTEEEMETILELVDTLEDIYELPDSLAYH